MEFQGPRIRSLANMSEGRTRRSLSSGSSSPARIFVVDDEDFIRELYKDMFEACGHTVFSARDGDEAIKIFREMENKPDCIIMDHRMPGRDGIQTTREILKLDPSIPIIFSSADESIRQQALDAGAVSFWAKPFPIGMLIDATVSIVNGKKRGL